MVAASQTNRPLLQVRRTAKGKWEVYQEPGNGAGGAASSGGGGQQQQGALDWVMEEVSGSADRPGDAYPEPFRSVFNGWYFATFNGIKFYHKIVEADTNRDTRRVIKEWEDEIDDIQQKIMAWKGSEAVHRSATAVINRYIAAKEKWADQRRAWEERQAASAQ